jgi:TusA-related sulfurtransferase
MSQPVQLTDRISTVLGRDPRMLDVLLACSPAFGHLRNPLLRKTMARLATVEHAARVAQIDPQVLLTRINAALAGEAVPDAPIRRIDAPAEPTRPDALSRLLDDQIVECDVREDLRSGREPINRIMAAARTVSAGQALRLRAIFEPVPLYPVLARKGFAHFTERLADDDWCVWFWHAGDAPAAADGAPADSADTSDLSADVVVLDVRGLEPPEPMVRTLEALEQLPRGKTLLQINVRVPQFLIPRLAERGFVYEVREQSEDLVRIFIRHGNGGPGAEESQSRRQS